MNGPRAVCRLHGMQSADCTATVQSADCTVQSADCARFPDCTEHIYIYTYKRVVCVCLLVCWFVCFLSATRHLSTLRRCLRVLRGQQEPSHAAPCAARASAHSESTRAHAVQLLNEKIAALMPFKNNYPYARACCRIRNFRDFQKKGKRKPTCHFLSSVYSLPSLGVFTFRMVLNRVLHKLSLLAPMVSFVTSHSHISL